MTGLTYLKLTTVFLCLALISCGKSNSKPSTPPTNTDSTTTTATMNIDCTLPFTAAQTELVISEPAGKVLLDTVVASTTAPLVATLKTNDTLLDVTLVMPTTTTTRLYAYTYKAINPSKLTSLNINSYQPLFSPGPTTSSTVVYYNLPAALTNYANSPIGDVYFTYFFTGSTGSIGSGDPSNYTLQYTYHAAADAYTYLLLPTLGLCKLHMQQQTLDSIDCSKMDTAIQFTFNRPFPFTAMGAGNTLYGIPDTNNLSNIISYTNLQGSIGTGLDFEYDPFPVEKYQANYFATDADNDVLYYYAYTDTLSKNAPLFQPSDYSIASSQADDFSVTFPGSRPTYYELNLFDSALSYVVLASPDSSTTHPITLLTNLKCKLLATVAPGDLGLIDFTMYNFNGSNYAGYFQYITNQAAIKAKPITYLSELNKNY